MKKSRSRCHRPPVKETRQIQEHSARHKCAQVQVRVRVRVQVRKCECKCNCKCASASASASEWRATPGDAATGSHSALQPSRQPLDHCSRPGTAPAHAAWRAAEPPAPECSALALDWRATAPPAARPANRKKKKKRFGHIAAPFPSCLARRLLLTCSYRSDKSGP